MEVATIEYVNNELLIKLDEYTLIEDERILLADKHGTIFKANIIEISRLEEEDYNG